MAHDGSSQMRRRSRPARSGSYMVTVTPWRAFRGPPNLPRRTPFQKFIRTSETVHLATTRRGLSQVPA